MPKVKKLIPGAVIGNKDKSARTAGAGSYLITLLVCLAAFIIVSAVPFMRQTLSADVYVPIHSILEFASIVVSFSVFAIGWYGFKQTRNRQDLLIAAIYLTIGALDFVHTLSYKGMPDFFGPNSPGKAAAYWLVARFFDGAALLGAAFVAPKVSSDNRRWVPLAVAIPVAVTALVVALVTSHETAIARALFVDVRSPLHSGVREGGLTPLKIAVEAFIMMLYAAAFIAFGRAKNWDPTATRLLQLALIVNIFGELAFTRYATPYDGLNLLGHVFKVAAYYLVLRALFVLSLQRPYEDLGKKEKEARDNLEAFKREERIADILQQSFLPQVSFTPPTGFQIAHSYQFAKYDSNVGGDFYDIFTLSDGKLAVVVGDVSGKGVKAAAYTLMARYALRACAETNDEPASAVTTLNRILHPQLQDGVFITLFYGVLDPESSRLTYVNAGHEQPVHIGKDGYTLLNSTGPILGISLELSYEQAEIVLEPGDVLTVLTDGITESRTTKGFLEPDGVAQILIENRQLGPEEMVAEVFDEAQRDSHLRDDAVIVLLRHLGDYS